MSRLGGAIIACIFAALWAYYGLSSSPVFFPWRYAAVLPSALIVAHGSLSKADPASLEWKAVKKRYFTVVGIEVLAIIVLSNVLVATRHMDLIWPGIAVIVGVHFIPLASVFGSRIYYITGASIAGLGLLEPFLPRSTGPIILGLGAALVLWTTTLIARRQSRLAPAL